MPVKYYPVFLDLSDKKVLVIGGGRVAARKIFGLLQCGAKVSVVAKTIESSIKKFRAPKKLKLFRRKFKRGDLAGRDLVFCASEDEALNRFVGRECRKKNIWVNVADRPSSCSFIVPSVLKRGEVAIAISTGGASPALAKFMRMKLEKIFGNEIGILSEFLRKFRGRILELPAREKARVIAQFVNERTLQRLRRRDSFSLEKKLVGLLERSA